MNNIVIFSELTTNDKLSALKVESEKYDGLYVDMNEPEQRKYVKEKADGINQLIKAVDKKRIAESKRYKVEVEAEAADITERLQIANLPFTLLIDEHKAERKKILDAEKARKDAIILTEKLECDHEFALLMNSQFDNDKMQLERDRIEYEKELKAQAVKEANEQLEKERQEIIEREKSAKAAQAQAELDKEAAQKREKLAAEQAIEQRKQDAINAESSRLQAVENERLAGIERERVILQKQLQEKAIREADVQNQAKVNNAILVVLMENNINIKDAKLMIKLAAKNQLPQLTINY